jgi:hypothetical protein
LVRRPSISWWLAAAWACLTRGNAVGGGDVDDLGVREHVDAEPEAGGALGHDIRHREQARPPS